MISNSPGTDLGWDISGNTGVGAISFSSIYPLGINSGWDISGGSGVRAISFSSIHPLIASAANMKIRRVLFIIVVPQFFTINVNRIVIFHL